MGGATKMLEDARAIEHLLLETSQHLNVLDKKPTIPEAKMGFRGKHESRRCWRVTYQESYTTKYATYITKCTTYITKCTTYTKMMKSAHNLFRRRNVYEDDKATYAKIIKSAHNLKECSQPERVVATCAGAAWGCADARSPSLSLINLESAKLCPLSSFRKVDVRLPGKGNSNSHGARPVHLIITMIQWIRTSRLSIKNFLCVQAPRGAVPTLVAPLSGPVFAVLTPFVAKGVPCS